ncbi:UNVERIFIED_CONTAM: hypothetical protein ACS92_05755 [Bacillus cereus]
MAVAAWAVDRKHHRYLGTFVFVDSPSLEEEQGGAHTVGKAVHPLGVDKSAREEGPRDAGIGCRNWRASFLGTSKK